MKVLASLENLRISPRKVRLVTDFVKGMKTTEALIQLDHSAKKSGLPIAKLVKSAVANAENNFGLDRDNLYIFDIQVGAGPVLKRWLPRAFGRATPLIKRTAVVSLVLEEIEEGKNRKTKEQLEKERKEREAAKDKMRKELEAAKEEKEKNSPAGEETNEEDQLKKEKFEGKSKSPKGGWVKKMFQRKSM